MSEYKYKTITIRTFSAIGYFRLQWMRKRGWIDVDVDDPYKNTWSMGGGKFMRVLFIKPTR